MGTVQALCLPDSLLPHSRRRRRPPLSTSSTPGNAHSRLPTLNLPTLSPPSSSPKRLLRVRSAAAGIGDIGEIIHNKVLVAAVVSAAIGQFTKPFASAIGSKRAFNLKDVFQAGGFPSSHSSTTVAATTALGLERGFSDPIFGLAVIYAGITMYDAQGVRREVGIHAKALNKTLFRRSVPSDVAVVDSVNARRIESSSSPGSLEPLSVEEASFSNNNLTGAKLITRSNKTRTQIGMPVLAGLGYDDSRGESEMEDSVVLLKESVGHTEVEVVAGAFLGFLVGLTVSTLT